jgi:hypothetical protein
MSSADSLVGREAEFDQAAAMVRELSDGRALTLAIEGQAGIGKTRLVESIIEYARSRDVAVFCGHRIPDVLLRDAFWRVHRHPAGR